MLGQWIVVGLVVAACAVYATWTLLPATARRRLAAAALAWPWPTRVAAFWRRHAEAASGCGCDGCDAGTPAVRPGNAKDVPAAGRGAEQPVAFHPRRPR
jgi:hypothetical protein